jgi:hypothetical protein
VQKTDSKIATEKPIKNAKNLLTRTDKPVTMVSETGKPVKPHPPSAGRNERRKNNEI